MSNTSNSKMHVLVAKGTDDKCILKNYLRSRGESCVVHEVATNKIKPIWNKFAKKDVLVVCSQYLIEEDADRDVVIRFIESFRDFSGNKFYIPRPNSFIEVDTPSIFASNNGNRFKTPIRRLVISNLRSIALRFPRSFKQKLSYAKHMLNVRYHQIKSSPSIQDLNFKPSIVVPNFLSHIKGSWIDWRDQIALHRDLIERNHLYFPHPKSMHVAIYNKCNLKCVMCPYHSPVYQDAHTSGYFDTEKSLSMDTFKTLADYAGARGISLQFGQIEETLLHPNLFDFISYAKKVGVPYVHVTTNGTLLTSAKAEKLANSGVDSVMFSVDSIDPETYKQIRGSNLERLERNIDYFLPFAKTKDIRVTCSFIRQEPASGQQDAFLHKWKAKGVDAVTFYVLSDHDPQTGEFIRTEQFRNEDERYPCASPWVQTVIMPDGDIGLCCKTMTDVGWKITSVGNINQKSFDQIWNSDNYKRVRQELLNNKFQEFSTCSKCPIWSASTILNEYSDDYVKSFNETMETITFIRS